MSKNPVLNTYNFVSTSNRLRTLDSNNCHLIIRQQPKQARLCSSKERDRRPVDPPPIVQLKVDGHGEEAQNFLQSPYYFMCANLVHPTSNEESFAISSRILAGTVVSSLHKLKDIDNTDGGFFVFGDISVRVEGRYRLRFSLFEIINDEVVHIQSVISEVFTVFSAKNFPGMSESTFLSRSFSDQGVRIRIRKEHRMQMQMKRPVHSDNADEEPCEMPIDPINQGPRRKRRQTFSAMDSTMMGDSPTNYDMITPHSLPNARTERSYSYPPVHPESGGGIGGYGAESPLSSQMTRPQFLTTALNSCEYLQQQPQTFYDSEPESNHGDFGFICRPSSVGAESSSSSGSTSHDIEERLQRNRLSSNSERYQPYELPQLGDNQQQQHSSYIPPPSSQPIAPQPTRRSTLPSLLQGYSPPNVYRDYYHHSSPITDSSQRNFGSTSASSTSMSSNSQTFGYNKYPEADSHISNPSPNATIANSSSSNLHPPSTHHQHRRPFPPRPPVRSQTLPVRYDSQRLVPPPPPPQLPTPRTSTDVEPSSTTSYLPMISRQPLRPPSMIDRGSDSSTGSCNNNYGNITAAEPTFTPHFTQSPRPSHVSPVTPLPSVNNSRSSTSRTASIPTISISESNAASPSPTLFPHPSRSTSSSSTTAGAGGGGGNPIILPPITSLMKGSIDPSSHNSINSSSYFPPEPVQPSLHQLQQPHYIQEESRPTSYTNPIYSQQQQQYSSRHHHHSYTYGNHSNGQSNNESDPSNLHGYH